jgi:hypothetical protein
MLWDRAYCMGRCCPVKHSTTTVIKMKETAGFAMRR